MLYVVFFFFFFFNDTATTEIYTLSLHDALPISRLQQHRRREDQGVEGEEDQQEAVHAAGKIPRQRRSAQVAPSLRDRGRRRPPGRHRARVRRGGRRRSSRSHFRRRGPAT